jgi:hypothetical protein
VIIGDLLPGKEEGRALFHDGEYITNEQMNEKKFLKLVKA